VAVAVQGSDVIIAGMGGQGAQLIGKLLAELLMPHYDHVTWFPAYSTLMRGGPTECTVIFSGEEISSPLVDHPSAAVVMDNNSFHLYADKMAPGGVFIMDSSIVKEEVKDDNIRVIKVPATELAKELGSDQAANFVLLGVYLKAQGPLPIETVIKGLSEKLRNDGKEKFIELNTTALRKGWDFLP
jgi:2-oxoglutarate ferredoxin oxidoreductase subunit gamma